MATVQRNKVVIYTLQSDGTWRAAVITTSRSGASTLAAVGTTHADINVARNAVYATLAGGTGQVEVNSEVVVDDTALLGK